VPVIITDAPIVVLIGLNDIIDKVPPKSSTVVAVMLFTATDIFPVVLPDGTVAVSAVGVLLVTAAVTPLNLTTLFEFTLLNPVPAIVTEDPKAPKIGLKPETLTGNTVNSVGLSPGRPELVTLTFPVVAPGGTVTVKLLDVAVVTVAFIPLNFTKLFAATELKFDPVIVIDELILPLNGLKLVTIGGGTKLFVLTAA
jgi:hypothetical protein